MLPMIVLGLSVRLLTWVFVISFFVFAYRWIQARSRLCAVLFAAGVVVRAVSGVALFAISFYELPLLKHLQLGGGFWTLAIDARGYYQLAEQAADFGFSAIPGHAPSALYIRALAFSLRWFGPSPATAVLLNTLCYAGSAMLIVAAATLGSRQVHDRTPVLAALIGLTLSPALLIFSTQPLKDSLCAFLIVAGVFGAGVWWHAKADGSFAARPLLVGAAFLATSIYGLAGIRAYVALLVIVSFFAAAVYAALTQARVHLAMRALPDAGLLVALWILFMVGAGSYYQQYENFMVSLVSTPTASLEAFDQARAGFVASGGQTALDLGELSLGESFGGLSGPRWSGRFGSVLRGCVVFFVPITLLKAASVVTFPGGRGLLFITDLDTIAVDLIFAASVGLIAIVIARRGLDPTTFFALLFVALTIILMGYVVTNYGTLFRLRQLAVAPLWMLPLLVRRAPVMLT